MGRVGDGMIFKSLHLKSMLDLCEVVIPGLYNTTGFILFKAKLNVLEQLGMFSC
ncbi:MAG: hypothetical protein F6K58_14220 [Symploca sp. SIO2E9]|nr:hypothetical protein [Symploca sp. SIO2E9]